MNTKTILLTLFCFSSSFSFCQQGLITCKTQNNPDNSISIYVNSQAKADYTIKIVFSSLSGYTSTSMMNSNVFLGIAHPGEMELIKFKRDNTAANFGFQYRYYFFPGRSFQRPPDEGFKYLLPATATNQLRVTMVSSTVSPLSQALKTEYRGTAFVYKPGDTICASRAGVVYDCSDTVKVGERTETVLNRNRNRIYMEHRDGTIGIYGVLAPIKLLVKPGDEVFPGQPLAVFTVESPKMMVLFSTLYLEEKRLLSENAPDNNAYFIYMPTHFWAGENDPASILETQKKYNVQHPKEIVSAEMTKREKKKMGF